MDANDKPGVLADVTRILAEANISVDSMLQKPAAEQVDGRADIIILTHLTIEKQVNAALAQIEALDTITGRVVKLRLEHLNG